MAKRHDVGTAYPFILPQSMIISGATKSGKSTLIKNLLMLPDSMFSPPVDKVIYVYSIWQDIYTELEAFWKDRIIFTESIPTKDYLLSVSEAKSQIALILDDKQSSLTKPEIADFVCVLCSHRNISTFILLQNFYYDSKVLRTVALNVQTIVLFRNRRSQQQVKTLATQICPGNTKFFMDAYYKATNQSNYSYLVIDLDPRGDGLHQFRTNIFPDEMTIVFTPETPS